MSTLLLTAENDKDLKKILELAKKLKIKAKFFTAEDIEDTALLKAMKEGRKSDFVSEKSIMETIKMQQKKIADGNKI